MINNILKKIVEEEWALAAYVFLPLLLILNIFGNEGIFFEETFRFLSVLFNCGFSFTLLFSFIEFIQYSLLFFNEYGFNIFLIRILPFLMHFMFLFIQISGYRLYKKKNKIFYFILFYFISLFIHGFYNNMFVNFLTRG